MATYLQGSHEIGSGVCLFHMVASNDLVSSTSINKLQVMQNIALRPATGCTQDTNIQHLHDETRAPTAIRFTIQTKGTPSITFHTHSIHKHQHSSTLQGSNPTIFNHGLYTTNISTDHHIVTVTDIKTNMRHMPTSIVSRHLATRANNKILCTPPPHISSSEEILPRLTRRTLAQEINHSYLHKVDANSPVSPLCPLCNIHTHDTHQLFNCTHIPSTLSPLIFCSDPDGVTALLSRWTELAGGTQAGRSDFPR